MRASLGDIGLQIDIPLEPDASGSSPDLTGATLTIVAVAPSGARSTWSASAVTLDDGTSVIRYTTAEDDLDEAGVWWLRARAVGSSTDLRAPEPMALEVYR